jgi:hypothetical protein
MSQTFATPTSDSTRGFLARVWADPESRSTAIGVTGVILIHVLLWLISPHVLRLDHVVGATRPHATSKEFNIEIDPETLSKAQPKQERDPFKFVETNPEAPENIPDKTSNFAAQNQQAAQEKPDPDGKNDRAATEGKKDFESNQIVSGRLVQPIERMEPVAPPVEAPPVETTPTPAARAEQNPLSGTEKFEGENKDGLGANIAKRLDNARPVPEKIDGVKDAPQVADARRMQPAIDPLRPRPRPQVVRQQQVRPAILAENKFGTKNVGLSGIDAKWSNYGAYLQRMIDTVQIQWERLILQMSAMPAGGSTVTVKFVMNDEGKISAILNVESTANETGSRACVSAITDRAPYGPWTDDMKAVLGSQQEMTFTFYYTP